MKSKFWIQSKVNLHKLKKMWLLQIEAKMMHGLNPKEHTFTWLTIAQTWKESYSPPYLVYSMIGNNSYIEMTKILGISKWESCFNFYYFAILWAFYTFESYNSHIWTLIQEALEGKLKISKTPLQHHIACSNWKSFEPYFPSFNGQESN
jgi:hypothetical protein